MPIVPIIEERSKGDNCDCGREPPGCSDPISNCGQADAIAPKLAHQFAHQNGSKKEWVNRVKFRSSLQLDADIPLSGIFERKEIGCGGRI